MKKITKITKTSATSKPVKAPKLEPTIIFEDRNFLVLNKPARLIVHNDGHTKEGSVVGWLEKNYPKLEGIGGSVDVAGGEQVERYGLVHRIDRDTSGILLVAKNQKTFDMLKQQFMDRKMKKTYQAFVYGRMIEDEGDVDLPIGRSDKDFRQWTVETGGGIAGVEGSGAGVSYNGVLDAASREADRRGATGRETRGTLRQALTHFKVLERASAFTFVELEPKTGRTHQLRVHLKALGHPIIADAVYAAKMPKVLGFERLALHARSITFTDAKGEKRQFEAPYPADFEKGLSMWQKLPNRS